jgi:hypothetical protein
MLWFRQRSTRQWILQIAQVQKLRQLLESHADESVQLLESDHITLCRFLKARKWDAHKAREMYIACAVWRSGPHPAPPDPPFKPEEIRKVVFNPFQCITCPRAFGDRMFIANICNCTDCDSSKLELS